MYRRGCPRGLRLVVCVVCVLFSFSTVLQGSALAQGAPVCTDTLSDQDVSTRLDWIERRLAAGTPYAASWWAGWLAFAAAEGIWGWVKFAQTSDRLDRDTWLVTGVGSALWVPQLLLWPLRSAYAVRGMRRLPHGTREQRRNSLPEAERLLERAAESEREGIGLTEHLLDTAWAVGSTAYIFGRSWRKADSKHNHNRVLKVTAVEFVLTELVTEAAILSTPRKAIRDYDRYREAGCDSRERPGSRARASSGSAPHWDVDLGANHFALTLRF